MVGGDFDLVPDLWLDRNPPRSRCHKYDDLIVKLMNNANLSDYWRMKNPEIRQFTWFNASGNGQRSRLDYWLITYIKRCSISVSPLTDHCVITLSFHLTTMGPNVTQI